MQPPVIAFDAMGVLYASDDDVAEVLIPYLRALDCHLPDSDIESLYRRASLGHLTTTELWAACGVDGDDETYCSRHTLTPGIAPLLSQLANSGFRLACLSNDVSEWSRVLRRRCGLDRWITTWIISGDTGVRKPDPRSFQMLVDAVGVPPQRIIFFDDRLANARAAKASGMKSQLFTDVPTSRRSLYDLAVLPIAR